MRRPAVVVGFTILVCLACSLAIYYGQLDALLGSLHSRYRVSRRSVEPVVWTWSVLTVLVVAAIANWKARRALVAFLTFSVFFALGLAEVGVRLFHPKHGFLDEEYWHDTVYQHVLPPSRTIAAADRQGRLRREPPFIVTNEDSFRTTYTKASFAAHKTRIAFLGDSMTQGYGVAEDATAVGQVEAALRKRFPEADVAVLNGGTTSYSPFVEELRYERVLREYHPQLVLLMLDETDFGDDAVYEATANLGPDGPHFTFSLFENKGKWPSLSDHVAILQRLSQVNRGAIIAPLCALFRRIDNEGNLPTTAVNGRQVPTRFFMYHQPRAKNEPYYARTLGIIKRIAEHVRRDGGQFGLVFVPRYPHWNPKESPKNWEAAEYKKVPNLDDDIAYFEEAKGKVDFDIFNLLPTFKAAAKASEAPLCFIDDPHWNERGNAIAGAAIVEHVVSEWPSLFGLPPAPASP